MPPPEGQDPEEKGTTDTGQEDKETKGKGTADQDTIDANSPFKAQLDLARQIAKEMRQGKTSQAKWYSYLILHQVC